MKKKPGKIGKDGLRPGAPPSRTRRSALEERYCQEYIKDLNATQAAIRAGYSKNGAGVTGCRLLRRPIVAARIAELAQERDERVLEGGDTVLARLATLAYGDVRELYDPETHEPKPIGELTREQAAMVQMLDETASGLRRWRTHPPLKALELLGRTQALFKDKVDASLSGNFTVRWLRDDEGDEE